MQGSAQPISNGGCQAITADAPLELDDFFFAVDVEVDAVRRALVAGAMPVTGVIGQDDHLLSGERRGDRLATVPCQVIGLLAKYPSDPVTVSPITGSDGTVLKYRLGPVLRALTPLLEPVDNG